MVKKKLKKMPEVLYKQISSLPEYFTIYDVLKLQVTNEVLHWLLTYYYLKDEEKDLIYKQLEIVNSQKVYSSEFISDSNLVSKSREVSNSQNIFSSSLVKSSTDVVDSHVVNNSVSIFESNFVSDSQDIVKSTTVSNSSNILKSTYVDSSTSVFNSNYIINSELISDSNNLKDCIFCGNCNELTNSLFCFGENKGQNLLFNAAASEDTISTIKKQFKMFSIRMYLADIDKHLTTKILPRAVYDYSLHYKNINKMFYEWLKTLPNYNPQIIYNLTLNKDLYLE